ncbi:DUF5709 domain-containing protein [Streptomyces sp. NBC_01190]|uniref:DUF5709 domain-containing protein n=1 Tax=Streptomyces sp. NBC_01190 TaxID=2903767 RepID=UPI00386FEFF8|nr:DUF5709 domain-containing protein [Streptomyces sp. NBC_01190]
MPEDELMGDEVYQPDGSEVQDDEGLLDPLDTLEDRGLEDDEDEGYSPPERPLGVNRFGVTAEEQRRGESLDQLLAEEEPDVAPLWGDGVGDSLTDGEVVDPEVGELRSGRLVSHDPGVPLAEGESADLWATDVGISGGAASAEEAAMHVVDDPQSVTYDNDF